MRKQFTVFGEAIEILVDSAVSQGTAAVLMQTSPKKGGPPPHRHTHEDETFTVLDGTFDIFDGVTWRPLPRGEVFFARRGGVYTFRNTGSSDATMLVFITPGGFEDYLVQLSPLSFPADAEQILAISQQFGVTFVS